MLRGRVVHVVLSLYTICLLTSLASAAERGLGLRPPTPEEQAFIQTHLRQVTNIAPNALAYARVKEEAARRPGVQTELVGLPTAVDNSTLAAFPPIGSQGGQNSCTAWSTAYYYNTYLQAMDEGYTVSDGNLDYICSPGFIYPLMNGGVDAGAVLEFTMIKLSEVGCSSWTDTPWVDTPTADTAWPSETAWVHALRNRTSNPNFLDGSTPAGIAALKQHLANGNLAVFGLNVYQTWYDDYFLVDAPGISNGVYYMRDGNSVGGHAMTLVGYDDAKSYVDSRDSLTHYGAFLVANSWGNGWGTTNTIGRKGYIWIAYSYFQDPNLWYYGDTNICFNDDRPDYRPALYAVTGINHTQRGNVVLSGSITGTATWDSQYTLDYLGGTLLPVTDTKRIAVDLTDGVSVLVPDGPSTVSVELHIYTSASGNGTITSADFFEDIDGDGTYHQTVSSDPTVTVTPGNTGVASAMINPSGMDYQLTDSELPTAMVWDEVRASSVTLRNISATTWDAADTYAVQDAGTFDRWNLNNIPLLIDTAPSASYTFPFDLTAPPVTTLTYPALASITTPPVSATLPLQLKMTHSDIPLVGNPLGADITVYRFSDIADNPTTLTVNEAWASPQIEECAGRVPMIVQGYGNGTYRPDNLVTRATMAVYMQRALAIPTAPYTGLFTDVPLDFPTAGEIQACVDYGIVQGYPDGSYKPTAVVNRGQMAVYVARGMAGGDSGVPTPSGGSSFSDVATSDQPWKYIEYAVAQGVVQGYSNGTYRPTVSVNRAAMAVYVYRAFIQPVGSAVVLGGPAITSQNPDTSGVCGWTSIASGPADNPGYAYVVVDGARLGTNLAFGGTWEVTFELREAADPATPAIGDYTTTVSLDTTELDTAVANARATGNPYHVITWDIPAGLTPGAYLLIVSIEDKVGVMHTEFLRQPSFSITP